MTLTTKNLLISFMLISLCSCVSKKRFATLQSELDFQKEEVTRAGNLVEDFSVKLKNCEGSLNECKSDRESLRTELKAAKTALSLREEQLGDFKNQLTDVKQQRPKLILLIWL